MADPRAWTLRLLVDGDPERSLDALEEHLETEDAFVQDAWVADRVAFSLIRTIAVHNDRAGGRSFAQRLVGWAHSRSLDLCVIAGEDTTPARGLAVFDADSTLVDGEGIDELALCAGAGSEVAAITARAMAGELDYAASLQARVALLRGLTREDLDEVASKLRLNPFAEEAVEAFRASGWQVAVLSGGFDFYLRELQHRLGVDSFQGNRLGLRDGRLTGEVIGTVVGAAEKRAHLLRLRDDAGLSERATVAVGDGANDGPMLLAAGLGLGYRAKPALLPHCDGVIARRDLRAAVALAGLVD